MKVIELQETDERDVYMDVDGNAYSTKRERIYKLTKFKLPNGYEMVYVDGRSTMRYVQRLMGNAYLGLDLKSKLQMNHINKVKDDNRLSNLEIVTPRQNMLHAHGHENYKDIK